MALRVKRAYEAASPDDGCRVLVDRLWPRGVSRSKAQIELWAKQAAPSRELRVWFAHEPGRWAEFKKRYFAELRGAHADELARIKRRARRGTVTLVYAAKDERHNNAVALREYLSRRGTARRAAGRAG